MHRADPVLAGMAAWSALIVVLFFVFDGDTGGIPEHFVYSVKTLERLGVSAVIIEDKIGLKKNSLFGTDVEQSQAEMNDFAHKIEMGKRAQVTDDFMIIGRIESLVLKKGMDDAIARARTYIAAGADGLMIEVHPNPAFAVSDGEQSLLPERFAELMSQIERVAASVDRPVAGRSPVAL